MSEKKENIPNKKTSIYHITKGKYRRLPKEDAVFMNLCDELIEKGDYHIISMVTNWIKKRKTLYDLKNMDIFIRWLYAKSNDWGTCDIFCYRIMNPMVEQFEEMQSEIIKWTESQNCYVRRAAVVCLLHSSQTFYVNVPFKMVEQVADILLEDKNIYVQNGVGWLLKYSYVSYPEQTINYIKKSVNKMSLRTFNYAIEKFQHDERNRMIKYRKNLVSL